MSSIVQLFFDLLLKNQAQDQILELRREKRQKNKAFCDARAADDAADAERAAATLVAKRVAARAARRALASASAHVTASASAPVTASTSAPVTASTSAHVPVPVPVPVPASASAPVPCSCAVLQSLVAAMSSK